MKNEIGKVPAPPFKKTFPYTILPPPFFNFSDSTPPEEVTKIYSSPPPLKRGGPNYDEDFKMLQIKLYFFILLEIKN